MVDEISRRRIVASQTTASCRPHQRMSPGSQPQSVEKEKIMFSAPSRSRLIVVLLLGCSALLVIGVSARKFSLLPQAQQAIQPRVTNRTTSMRVFGIRQLNNGDMEVTFVNQSTKAIYAYMIVTSVYPTRKGITAFATDAPVAPGETKAERIHAGNVG